ncbi:unnamed protein product [Porites evermanni]|uniref:Ig-like domain-containing protein n=1 Tax=Porites evermanni TaxID=104178 RepID=A0ABN8RU49_9CNID|nr:unnamed protein product [Porites evermanni]
MWGSQVLDNSTGVPRAELNMEGKYTCKATSQAGTDSKEVRVSFTTCPFCSQAEGQWYSHWGNTLSCSNVRSPADINCASTLAEVLNLSSNDIATLDADIFSSLGHLDYLSLSFNKLELLPDTIFTNLTELQYL